MSQSEMSQDGVKGVIMPGADVVASNVAELRQHVKTLLAGGVRELVMDLSHVAMVDSKGIGLLVAAQNSLAAVGGRLTVAHANADLLELFRAMRLDQHFVLSA